MEQNGMRCWTCGTPLAEGRRRHSYYCGAACKQKAYRRRLANLGPSELPNGRRGRIPLGGRVTIASLLQPDVATLRTELLSPIARNALRAVQRIENRGDDPEEVLAELGMADGELAPAIARLAQEWRAQQEKQKP